MTNLILGVMLLWSSVAPAASSSVEDHASKRFLEEYRGAAERLRERFGGATAEFRLVETNPKEGDVRGRVARGIYASSGRDRKVEADVEIGTGDNRRSLRRVYCVSPDQYFQLSRPEAAPVYRVDDLMSHGSGDGDPFVPRFGKYFDAPDSIVGTPLLRIIDLPTFQLLGAVERLEDGRELIEITFEYGDWSPRARGVVLFDPGLGWAIRRSKLSPGRDIAGEFDCSITYPAGGADVPFPSLVVLKEPTGGEGRCEITSARFAELPAHEFSLDHYGLGGIRPAEGRSAASGWRFAPAFTALGVVGLMAALLLGRVWARVGRQ